MNTSVEHNFRMTFQNASQIILKQQLTIYLSSTVYPECSISEYVEC